MVTELNQDRARHMLCEQKSVYMLLMINAGMMGAYTFTLRGGAFCNAQTANIVLMAIAFGQGRWSQGLYFLIPISAYFLGAFLSELSLLPSRKFGPLRWDTWLVGIELVTLFLLGFLPLSVPYQIVQIIINFLASMQYNTFRKVDGIPMATTFCTNHVRQLGITAANIVRRRDPDAYRRSRIHLKMLACFFGGGTLLSWACGPLAERAIWLSILPLALALTALVRDDLGLEPVREEEKP